MSYDPTGPVDPRQILLDHFKEHRPEDWANATLEDIDTWCVEQAEDLNKQNPGDTEDPWTAEDMLANAFDNHNIGRDFCEACDV